MSVRKNKIYVLLILLAAALAVSLPLLLPAQPGAELTTAKMSEKEVAKAPEREISEAARTDVETEKSLQEQELTAKLHAGAAVLLDMDSGRVLYEKNGNEALPMASTTKIMTCIVALEEGERDDIVTASAYAAGQPKVRLGMEKGMSFKMDDLLYSLMLESHNDTAVAIAEHIGGEMLGLPGAEERSREQSLAAVGAFCDKMTAKAKEIGCDNTLFLTPNGLDAEAEGENGEKIIHSTTAAELARIMRYCVTQSEQREAFLEITGTAAHAFTDVEGKRSYTCNNHNALLTMLEGAFSGKTGFTSRAGYCYVGALERDGKKFAVALLACGWPGHKGWKWEDCRQLFAYGLDHYEYREFMPETALRPIPVTGGASEGGNPYRQVSVPVVKKETDIPLKILVKEGEKLETRRNIAGELTAPVETGKRVGAVSYYLIKESGENLLWAEEGVYTAGSVREKDFCFILTFICRLFLKFNNWDGDFSQNSSFLS